MTTKAWAALQRRYCVALLKIVFFEADTSAVRLILMCASGLSGAIMLWHALEGSVLFERPAYALMSRAGGAEFWGIAFLLHFFGGLWRVVDPKELVWAGIAVNFYGFFLWFSTTLCINLSLGTVLPSSAPEWTMIFASGWALYRTGLRREKISA